MFLIKVSISQHILRSRYLYSQGNAEDIVHVPDQSMFSGIPIKYLLQDTCNTYSKGSWQKPIFSRPLLSAHNKLMMKAYSLSSFTLISYFWWHCTA